MVVGGPCISTGIGITINLMDHSMSGILPSMILASPLGVSSHRHFVQEIGGDVHVWQFLGITARS